MTGSPDARHSAASAPEPAPPALATIVQRPAGRPGQLILLFHAAGADPSEMLPLARRLAAEFPQAFVVSVGAPEASASETGREWFADEDPDGPARSGRVAAAMPCFLATIRHWQEAAGVAPEATAVVGFAQGATMALECAGEREAPAGRVVSIAGRFARLPDRVPADATFYMLHGKADEVVPCAHTVAAAERIVALGGDVIADVIPAAGHAVDDRIADLLIERLRTHIPKRHWAAAMRATGTERVKKS